MAVGGDSYNGRGRGGPVAANARALRDGALCRLASLLTDGNTLDDHAKIAAARELLKGPRTVVKPAQRQRALETLRKLIESDDTADAAVVEATRLLCDVATHGRKRKAVTA